MYSTNLGGYDEYDAALDAWDDKLVSQGLPKDTYEAYCPVCRHLSPLTVYNDEFSYDGTHCTHGIGGFHRSSYQAIVTACCEAEPVMELDEGTDLV